MSIAFGYGNTLLDGVALWLGESGAGIDGRTGVCLDDSTQLSLRGLHRLQQEFGSVVAAEKEIIAVRRLLG